MIEILLIIIAAKLIDTGFVLIFSAIMVLKIDSSSEVKSSEPESSGGGGKLISTLKVSKEGMAVAYPVIIRGCINVLIGIIISFLAIYLSKCNYVNASILMFIYILMEAKSINPQISLSHMAALELMELKSKARSNMFDSMYNKLMNSISDKK